MDRESAGEVVLLSSRETAKQAVRKGSEAIRCIEASIGR